MNIYHSYYRFWRNFNQKQDFCWVAITKTIPNDFVGNVYRKLAPIGKNFDAVENPFNEELFFIEYNKLLDSLDKKQIIKDLKAFSKHEKDVVILNWEDLTRESEGRYAYSWFMNIPYENVNYYDLENVLKRKDLIKDISGFNFLDL